MPSSAAAGTRCFSGNDVIVGGQTVVREGVHPHEEQALADYRRAVARPGD